MNEENDESKVVPIVNRTGSNLNCESVNAARPDDVHVACRVSCYVFFIISDVFLERCAIANSGPFVTAICCM